MEFTTGGRLEVRITPDDVGKRVSVRSMTGRREGTGRFTDTVGVLTSWSDGVLRITRRNGEEVDLAEQDVIAGKVVPAAPARRRVPAATVRELERVTARARPPRETEVLGAWTLRAGPGATRRANSVLALGAPGTDVDTALDRVTHWYAERGLVPRVQVPLGDAADRSLDAALDARGWSVETRVLVYVGALAPLADREPDRRVRIGRHAGPGWLRAYARTAEGADDAAARNLDGGESVWFAEVPDVAERPPRATPEPAPEEPEEALPAAAIGRCAVDGRWAGFHTLEVSPAHRRQGLATAVVAELARTALREGASAGYVLVEEDDAAAAALCRRLGFAVHHACVHRAAPEAGER